LCCVDGDDETGDWYDEFADDVDHNDNDADDDDDRPRRPDDRTSPTRGQDGLFANSFFPPFRRPP